MCARFGVRARQQHLAAVSPATAAIDAAQEQSQSRICVADIRIEHENFHAQLCIDKCEDNDLNPDSRLGFSVISLA